MNNLSAIKIIMNPKLLLIIILVLPLSIQSQTTDITIVVHGYSPFHTTALGDFWEPMLDTIARVTNGNVRRYDETTHTFETIPSPSHTNHGDDHHVLFYKWNFVSLLLDNTSAFVESSAENLVAALHRSGYFNPDYTRWHIIGYSRGAALVSEAVERIMSLKLVDLEDPSATEMTVTYLDPHDWGTTLTGNSSDENTPCNGLYTDMQVNDIQFSEGCVDTRFRFDFFQHPQQLDNVPIMDGGGASISVPNDTRPNTGAIVWHTDETQDNISFLNFFQLIDEGLINTPSEWFNLSGRPVVGSLSQVIRDENYDNPNTASMDDEMNHNAILKWYTQTVHNDMQQSVADANSGGWAYSVHGAAYNQRDNDLTVFDPGMETLREPLYGMHLSSQGFLNGNFERGDFGTFPGWEYFGGEGLGTIGYFDVNENGFFDRVDQGFLKLEANQDRSHNWTYLPVNLDRIYFLVRAAVMDGGELEVEIKNDANPNWQSLRTIPINEFNFTNTESKFTFFVGEEFFNDWNDFPGTASQIRFRNTGNSEIHVDNIYGIRCIEECVSSMVVIPNDGGLLATEGAFICRGKTKILAHDNMYAADTPIKDNVSLRFESPSKIHLKQGFRIGGNNVSHFSSNQTIEQQCDPCGIMVPPFVRGVEPERELDFQQGLEKSSQSIEDEFTLEAESSFFAVPNPFEDYVEIRGIDESGLSQITIQNSSGQILKQFNSVFASNIKLSTAELIAGIYFVQVRINNKSETIKIIKTN